MGRSAIVIRRAIAIGRQRLPFLFGLAALIFVPLGLLDAIQSEVGEIDTERLSDTQALAGLAAAAAHAASALLGEVLYAGAVAIAVISTPPDQNPSLRRIIRQTRWRTLIVIDILFAVGVIFSLLLLVIPGIIFFARYVLCAVLAEIEELGVRDAFRRSAELSRGSRRLVLGLLLSTYVLSDLATELAGSLAGALGADHLIVAWAAAAGGEILFNPVAGLLAVALVLELGGRPKGAAPGQRPASA